MNDNLLNTSTSFWAGTSTVNKIMLIGFPTILAGVAIWYFGFRNSDVQVEESGKKPTDEKSTTTETKTETTVSEPAKTKVAPVPASPAAPSKPSVPSVDVAGKKVADALLKNDPKSLFGKKVYAYNDKTPVYTLQNKQYTVAKKGQLLGTFSNPKPLKEGGNVIVIVSNDPKNKFIVVKDAYLTF